MSAAGTEGVYAFDNRSEHASPHHTALSALLDPGSTGRIQRLVSLPGARVLEVGYGGGALARWMAEQVGPQGHVLAVDLDPIALPETANLETRQLDIVTDEVPEPGTWNLIHARLLLNHLPARRAVLAKLAAALAPGGVVLTEDWQGHPPEVFVAFAPTEHATEVLTNYHAAMLAVLDSHGNTRRWATAAHAAMREEGLVDVQTEVHSVSWPGGSVASMHLAATSAQVRDELVATGLIDDESMNELPQILKDPEVTLHGHLLYATSGVKPA
jgi:SAM-dependent methyltransferase